MNIETPPAPPSSPIEPSAPHATPPPSATTLTTAPPPSSTRDPLLTIPAPPPSSILDSPPSPVPEPESDEQAFQRLARLSPVEYDRLRRAEAKGRRLRLATLDAEVARCRALLDDVEANAVNLPTFEPWPEPVDGPDTVAQVAARFTHYVVLPPGAADALALFTPHAHAFNAFYQSPRLNLYSPKRGCGKTTTLDVLTTMVPRPFRAENIRAPVLFRVVDQQQPTLLLDEVDTYLHSAHELRGLLNAGHKRGSHAYRCEGGGSAIRAFKAFAPAALAGIGLLPPTLHDRSILIPLAQAQSSQPHAHFDEHHTDLEHTLGRKLACWASDNFNALAACHPPLPPTAFNRLADNWRPLFAIAQVLGGDWPQRAADAFALLTPKPLPELDLGQLLVADLRFLFAQAGATRLFSSTIVHSLRALPDRPWSGATHSDKPLTEARLARYLSAFGVHSETLRIGHSRAKGYALVNFPPA